MNGHIFLAGGSITETETADGVYFDMHASGDKILYIPIALGAEKHESCISWFRSVLAHHNVGETLSFDAIGINDAIPVLTDYKSVYLGGGNTYELLDYVRKSGLDERLIQYLDHGGIVYGGSAGAMILGKDIRTAAEENLTNTRDHRGLNLLNDYSVICHYNSRDAKKMNELVKTIQSNIVALPNNGCVHVNLLEQRLTIYGTAVLYGNVKEVELSTEHNFLELHTLLT